MINGGRFDIQRQNRLLLFPSHARQLVNVNEKKNKKIFFLKLKSFSLNLIYMD